MRKYYRELCEWTKTKEADNLDRWKQSKIHHEKERVMSWILNAEKMIQIQFIETSSRDEWGGHTGY
jgi:hypothetical protein